MIVKETQARPGAILDGLTRLHHGSHQPNDVGQACVEENKVGRHGDTHITASAVAALVVAVVLASVVSQLSPFEPP